jgi:hypothetical protein
MVYSEDMPREYSTQRIDKQVLKALRKYEKKHKLKPSISNTIDHLLAEAIKKAV